MRSYAIATMLVSICWEQGIIAAMGTLMHPLLL